MLEIENLIDERVTSDTTCRCLIVCTVVCAYPLAFTKVKNSLSSVCPGGGGVLDISLDGEVRHGPSYPDPV